MVEQKVEKKFKDLKTKIKAYGNLVIGFSGGVDNKIILEGFFCFYFSHSLTFTVTIVYN